MINTTVKPCTHNRSQLLRDLEAPLVWISWLDKKGGFLGKSDITIKAEDTILNCDACKVWLYENGGRK